jgi:glutathione S-transferase
LELNEYLATRSYLIGEKLSLADLVVYYSLVDIVDNLLPNEKEQYLNLSRYFDFLQNSNELRQGAKVVNFATIHLLGWNSNIKH